MTDEEQTYEYSEFSGQFSDDGVVVELRIYRPAGTNHDWVLEVIDEEGFPPRGRTPSPPIARPLKNSLQPSSATAFRPLLTSRHRRFTDPILNFDSRFA